MGRSRQKKTERQLRFEQFEQRMLMAADGAAFQTVDVDQFVEEITPLVANADLDGQANQNAANQHGFDGSGQTIAIIDSGIAWDHAALGGGYGDGNKVVGGWDFAENDANPYDDGPAGFHGTHVAGIAAGDGNGYQGVASGADLVGLRVFNDQGVGKIEWVESALKWVRNNLNSFRNPITTVNMSLGADWSETASDWSVITDELQALEAEGVFISVAAGNDFADVQSKVLSHPAANEHVVAVASHDSQNQLSDFSQRDDQVLVAPGENIASAVPNHLFGTRKVDQLLGASGTSMAAPYVAGASAVLRQAYAAAGYGEVDQDTLYDTFIRTSNSIYDKITNTTYRQLDLDAAIESITEAINTTDITDIGTLDGGELLRGTINAVGGSDHYRFTSPLTGQVELTFEATEKFDPTLEVTNSQGDKVQLQFDQDRVYINVTAGDSYQLEVGSLTGAGHYQISTAIQQSQLTSNLGVVDSINVSDVLRGDRTWSLTASNSGPMVFGFETVDTNGSIEIYDANMNRLTSQSVDDGRVDFQFDVEEGETLYVLLKADGRVDLSVDNLVSIENGTLTVNGTEGSDSFVVNGTDTLQVELNGQVYSLSTDDVSSIVINGDAQQDSIQLNLGEEFTRTVLREDRVDSFAFGKTFRAIGFNRIDVTGSGSLTVAGSEANDVISGNYDSVQIATATGRGFDVVIADGKGGHDRIELEGSSSNDILFSKDNYTAIRNESSRLIAINYEELGVEGGGGHDLSNLFGTQANDEFSLGTEEIKVSDRHVDLTLTGFERATAFKGDGHDTIVFTDSEGNDRFLYSDGTTQLVSESTHLVAHQFNDVTVNTSGGYDVAQIDGTAGNERLTATRGQSVLEIGNGTVDLNSFERVNVVANFEGYDSVDIIGTDGNDQLYVDSNSATTVFSGGSIVRTVGFGDVSFDGNGGYDANFLKGSEGNDTFVANNQESTFRNGKIKTVAREVELTRIDGQGGTDSVFVDDVLALDVIASIGEKAFAVLERHQIEAENISLVEATAVDGIIATYDMQRVDFQSVLRGNWIPR